MSAPVPSTRRLAIAIGTAAASATVAIGVTAASLLGWFNPAAGQPGAEPASETSAQPAPASSPVILVPVAPAPAPPPAADPVGDVQLAMTDVGGRGRSRAYDDDQERRDHGRDREDGEDDEDDEDDDD